MTGITPFQTAGPFLSLGLGVGVDAPLPQIDGPRISIAGRLLDGAGDGVPDGVLEFWQADARAFRRVLTGPDGGFQFETVRSPFVSVVILGRGILTIRYTRIYLDLPEDDAVLRLVPSSRRGTLLAKPAGANRYQFDVVLQGEHETVFFDV